MPARRAMPAQLADHAAPAQARHTRRAFLGSMLLPLCMAALLPGLAQGAGKIAEKKNKNRKPPAKAQPKAHRSLLVQATAYNSTAAQTDGSPHHGAWGDRLDGLGKGTRAVAVSPDLLRKGLHRGQRLRIEGLQGEFVVLDRTPSRWKNRIDIHMGKDVRSARRWGKRRVRISWRP